METKSLVPKLRFPEFRDAPEWELKPLRDVTDHLTKKVGDRQLIPVSISAGTGFVSQAEKFGRDISGAQYRNYIHIRQGDFSYNKGNSKRYPQGCVYELKEFEEAAAPSAFVSFRFRRDYVNEFFQPQFEKNSHGRELRKFITSGARSDGLLNVSPDEFFSVQLPVPHDRAEQQKIAECLTSLDELIAAEGRKLEALRNYKNGLMQNLFPREGESTPRLRFPEFRDAGEWEEQRIDNLARRGTGHTPSRAKPEYYDGGIKWVSLSDSFRLDQGLISETSKEISDIGVANSSAVLHPVGTVILSRDAGVGKSAVMKVPMAVSQHFIAWTCNEAILHNWFLYYTLQRLKPTFERIASGSTIKTIGLPYFTALRILVPTPLEQREIADCLVSLDALTSTQAKKLDTLKLHKQGLMQGIFPSSEVRLT